jgi:hypothetical protein
MRTNAELRALYEANKRPGFVTVTLEAPEFLRLLEDSEALERRDEELLQRIDRAVVEAVAEIAREVRPQSLLGVERA